MTPTIRNVVFDLGGVLVGLDPDRCKEAFERLGMPEVARLIDPCYPAEMIGRFEKGEISFHEACDQMRRLSNRPDVSDETIAEAYGSFQTDVPITKLRMIERLRRCGIRTYVLSNNNPVSMRFIRRFFEADGRTMDDYFDRIYLSHELHELKPSPAIFRKMIDDSGIIPEETLFIDDARHNVDTARSLGFAVYMPAPGEEFGELVEEICLSSEA